MNFGTGTETISTGYRGIFSAGTLRSRAWNPELCNSLELDWRHDVLVSQREFPARRKPMRGRMRTLRINFAASASVVLSFRTLNNNGTATWSGSNGSLFFINGAVINNGASSVWNYANDSTLGFGGGAAVAFNNAGTLEKTGGTVTSTISGPVQAIPER